jgi:dihydrofolate synthase/folylpolyglutamate synthase
MSLPDLGARPQGAMHSSDFTLERMQRLMAVLRQPQQRYASVHVAGTNGKGSVCALCAAALQAAGYRTGLYTSPHLDPLEGIWVDGAPVGPEALEETFCGLQLALDGERGWTAFEVVTALAFQHFARAGVQVAVIEVGLGGRLDATNMITPNVSVITPIDYEHTSILGKQLAQIAGEKSGIIKEGVPVVTAPQAPEARAAIAEIAALSKARLVEVGVDVRYKRIHSDLSGQVLEIATPSPPLPLGEGKGDDLAGGGNMQLKIRMLGMHQQQNAATAFAVLRTLAQNGMPVSDEAIRQGFAAARWPGRFEVIDGEPLLVLDAAHSPHAARALRATLDAFFPSKKFTLVLGVSADKDLSGIIDVLRSRIDKVIATQSAHPRAMPAAELAGKLDAFGLAAKAEPDAGRALLLAQRETAGDGLVLICGSVFLVELIRKNHLASSKDPSMR